MEKTTTGEMNAGNGVIGTGPFKFVSWSPDDNVVVERNDDYWGEKAAWDKVTFRVFKNPSARVAAMRSEEHTSELQSLMRISYAVFCLKKHIIYIVTHKTLLLFITLCYT